eukprot:g1011.t1
MLKIWYLCVVLAVLVTHQVAQGRRIAYKVSTKVLSTATDTIKSGGDDLICDAGEAITYSIASKGGKCDDYITTSLECKVAAELNKASGIYIDARIDSGRYFKYQNATYSPRGCYRDKNKQYWFNHNFESTFECGKYNRDCVCKTKVCVKCPKNTYSTKKQTCEWCPSGTHSIDPRQACKTIVCKEGEGMAYPDKKLSGYCDAPITSAAECEAAAKYNKKHKVDNNKGVLGNLQKYVKDRPYGCFHDSGGWAKNVYYFNPDYTSRTKCGIKERACVCKSRLCNKCPPHTYSLGGENAVCKECKAPKTVNPAQTQCENRYLALDMKSEKRNERLSNKISSLNNKMMDVFKLTKQSILTENLKKTVTGGQKDKLPRMLAEFTVRDEYDKAQVRDADEYQKYGKDACKAKVKYQDSDRRRVKIFSAIPLYEEVTANTCLRINRDEIISAFCNFKSKFDIMLSGRNIIENKGSDILWPNICCPSVAPTKFAVPRCSPPSGSNITQEEMVPFALAQGGEVSQISLYGEIVRILDAKNGYLIQGMLKALKFQDNTGELQEKILRLFNKIHLCGPRVFNSPTDESIQMCELFYPYRNLMSAFYKAFEGLFTADDLTQLKADVKIMTQKAQAAAPPPPTSDGEFIEIDLKSNRNARKYRRMKKYSTTNTECGMKLRSKIELKSKKEKVFCSMYQPFDTKDQRIMNFAMFHISEDFTLDDPDFNIVAENSKFIAGDRCFYNSPMISSISIEKVKLGLDETEWVLLAKLNSSPTGYLSQEAEECNGPYLAHDIINVAVYFDEHRCCPNTKNMALCEQCSSNKTPTALYHHWTGAQLFYTLTAIGKRFKLELDGNPILIATKYTYLHKTNSVKPKPGNGEKLKEAIMKVVESKNNNNRRRRLLGWNAHWKEFTADVKTTQGSCNSELLKDVHIEDSGSFRFECSKAKALCACIQHVGSSGEEQHFLAGNVQLNVFRLDGTVSYEIFEDGNSLAYGDVNDGMVNKRRRRLLSSRGGGGS